MKESRMDRIERGLEEFIRGVKELHAAIDRDRIANAELRASIAELRESQKETGEYLSRIGKKVDDMRITLGNLGVIDGKVAEDLFYRNVRHVFRQKNISFSDVQRNVRKKGIPGEYDIVAVNNGRVLVVEVKKKMEQHMIDDFLDRRIPKFRQIFPEYRDFPLIGGVGALVMQDSISRYAEKKGLYVMTQNGEGGAMLINRENFMAKEF